MKKEEFVALGISEELADKAAAASAEELKGYVPMKRFNEVNEAKKTAEQTIEERDKQLEGLKKTAGDVDNLKETIEKLQGENKAAAAEHEKAMKALKREGIDQSIIAEAGAKNATAVMALMNAAGAADEKLDEDAYKAFRMKQLENVKKDNDYLFNTGAPSIHGASPMHSPDGAPDPNKAGFETRLAEARKTGNTAGMIAVKREAAQAGVFLM